MKEQIEELSEANSKQADDIVYLQGMYDKETKTMFFANAGGVIGFDDYDPLWGVTANFGIKLSKGLMLSTGATYMEGSFTQVYLIQLLIICKLMQL